MIFVDPKEDIAFKKIFADEHHPAVIISFINAVLGLEGQECIEQIKILNPYQVPTIKGLKSTVLDIQAQDMRGFKFIVEMQVERDEHFAKRAVFYSSKAYSTQIKVAKDYSKLNPVYFIGVLDFKLLEGEDYLSRHLILNEATGKQELKDLVWNFIELPKFKLAESALETTVQKWVYFLKHAGNLERIPAKLQEESSICEAFDIANQHSWNEKELRAYDYWSMREGIRVNSLSTAKKVGFAKGKEVGLAKGKEEGFAKGKEEGFTKGKEAGFSEGEQKKAFSIGRKMKAQGINTETIVKITGLSTEEVNRF